MSNSMIMMRMCRIMMKTMKTMKTMIDNYNILDSELEEFLRLGSINILNSLFCLSVFLQTK